MVVAPKARERGDSLWNYAGMTTCGLLCNIEAATFMGESWKTLVLRV
jgi:hypothetical protein